MKMKRFLINTALWYILLSIGMFIAFILFDMHGHLLIRLLISMALAIIKPIYNIIEIFKNKNY
jgi:hypothetical protein